MLYFSPYLIVIGASKGIVAGSMIVFTFLFILSLFLGKFSCGYFCPLGGLQECMMLANNKKTKGGKRNYIKYWICVPWVISIAVLFILAGGFSEVDPFFQITDGVSLNEPSTYLVYYGIVSLVVVLALIFGKRAFCHYMCWIAPLLIVGTKIANWLKMPVLHIKADKTKCVGCKKCSEKCPMSLDVKSMVETEKMANSECILCGECIDICQKKAITYSFKRK